MDKLKPCPFCGSNAEILRVEGEIQSIPLTVKLPENSRLCQTVTLPNGSGWQDIRRKRFIPRCMDCDCIGRLSKLYLTEHDAIEAWNRRSGGDSCD